MADGFLGRWSQRKQAVREGKLLDEPAPAPVTKSPPVLNAPEAPAPELPPPSLEDAQRLTPESDFTPFVARDVAPAVRNAAMKKLFADPHYNVMDGLDTYIDDYSRPDPLPASMLRQMASAKFLKLFEDEEEDSPGSRARDDADTPVVHSVAESAPSPPTGADHPTENEPKPQGSDHDDTDMRLQPNHAAGPREPGRGTE